MANGKTSYVISTKTGTFVALRYSEEAAIRAIEDFSNRWKDLVCYKEEQ